MKEYKNMIYVEKVEEWGVWLRKKMWLAQCDCLNL
jgi:hypothetical protein